MQRGTWAAIGIVAMIGMPAAAAETVRGTAQIDGVDSAVELQTGEGIGELRYRPLAGAARWETVPLDTLAPVIAILADRRLPEHDAVDETAIGAVELAIHSGTAEARIGGACLCEHRLLAGAGRGRIALDRHVGGEGLQRLVALIGRTGRKSVFSVHLLSAPAGVRGPS